MSVSSWGFQLIISFKKSIIFCEFIIYFVPKINKIWPNSPWPFSLIPVSILRNKILHLWLNRLCFSFSKTIGHRNRPMGTKLATGRTPWIRMLLNPRHRQTVGYMSTRKIPVLWENADDFRFSSAPLIIATDQYWLDYLFHSRPPSEPSECHSAQFVLRLPCHRFISANIKR